MSQTWQNLEILVGDDCPDDAVAEVVDRLAAEDARIIYRRNPGPAGGRSNFVGLLTEASSDYIKYLNDDDRLAPDCVAKMVNALLQHPRVTIVTSRRILIDVNGAQLDQTETNAPLADFDYYAEGVSLMDAILEEEHNVIGEPTTTLFRRSDLNWVRPNMFAVGAYEVDWNGDLAMWLNLLGRGDVIYLNESLSEFRLHESQLSAGPDALTRGLTAWAKIRREASKLGFLRVPGPKEVLGRPLAAMSSPVGAP
jgi:glycosyltransferase involved in cell wall biosynthesis